MLDVFNIAKPQNCDIQIFYGDGTNTATKNRATWIKPRGVSHVYMLLIGAGGNGNGTSGGGSGTITVFYTAAQNIPDNAGIWVGNAEKSTYVTFVRPSGLDYIHAPPGVGTAGGSSVAGNYITAMGFYQSIAGQSGVTGVINPSGTSFITAGGSTAATGEYGYSSGGGTSRGYFQLQPIIVGYGGAGTTGTPGGIGCGGGASGTGGPGMVLIASW